MRCCFSFRLDTMQVSGLRRRMLRRVRKSIAQRYYQLLSGHAAIGSFLHDLMAGPQRLGVPLGAPEGTGFAMVVEGGSHRGSD